MTFIFTDFDAIDDLRRNFGGLKMPPVQASSTEYGAYLQKRNPSRQGGPRMKQVPVGTDVCSCNVLQHPLNLTHFVMNL